MDIKVERISFENSKHRGTFFIAFRSLPARRSECTLQRASGWMPTYTAISGPAHALSSDHLSTSTRQHRPPELLLTFLYGRTETCDSAHSLACQAH